MNTSNNNPYKKNVINEARDNKIFSAIVHVCTRAWEISLRLHIYFKSWNPKHLKKIMCIFWKVSFSLISSSMCQIQMLLKRFFSKFYVMSSFFVFRWILQSLTWHFHLNTYISNTMQTQFICHLRTSIFIILFLGTMSLFQFTSPRNSFFSRLKWLMSTFIVCISKYIYSSSEAKFILGHYPTCLQTFLR